MVNTDFSTQQIQQLVAHPIHCSGAECQHEVAGLNAFAQRRRSVLEFADVVHIFVTENA
jgi:hypothetical protein